MTREQKVDITLEELDREITIATYQEKRSALLQHLPVLRVKGQHGVMKCHSLPV
ncbi:hypothetical protein [Clostridium sp. Marseille-P2415]|uniref:hypothetical protein n=1 Tax=Clostridium sp. Marseille-P2415 TaxID=1805471 RepID=UPI0013566AEF|nr:hypothetical protein [Clostridium sp. Marseille-P2415]